MKRFKDLFSHNAWSTLLIWAILWSKLDLSKFLSLYSSDFFNVDQPVKSNAFDASKRSPVSMSV